MVRNANAVDAYCTAPRTEVDSTYGTQTDTAYPETFGDELEEGGTRIRAEDKGKRGNPYEPYHKESPESITSGTP